jgi:hypothetical protein
MSFLGCCRPNKSVGVLPPDAVSSAGASSSESDEDKARRKAADAARKTLDGGGEPNGAAAAEDIPEGPGVEFEVNVRAGNGMTFKVSVAENMKINDLHSQISRLLGEGECPVYAIRLIYKTKVLSHSPSDRLRDFGIVPPGAGDPKPQLQLVVVRGSTRALLVGARARRRPFVSLRPRASPTRRRLSSLPPPHRPALGQRAPLGFGRGRASCAHMPIACRPSPAQVRDGAAPKVEVPRVVVQVEKQPSSWRRRASWDPQKEKSRSRG